MSLSNSSIININQLPESFNIEPLDFFFINSANGTQVVCFDNLVFNIEQTAFEDEFNQQTADLRSLSGTVDSLYNDLSSFIDGEVEKVRSLSADIFEILNESIYNN